MALYKVKLNPEKPKKRGRPVGSKNKKPTPAQMQKAASKIAKSKNPISDFQKTLAEWDRMENQVNWEDIAKKQEQTINVYKIENEAITKICKQRWDEIEHLKYLITYLERKLEDASI
jgi:hypothetical protein